MYLNLRSNANSPDNSGAASEGDLLGIKSRTPARVEPAGIEDCGTRSSDYFESLAHARSGKIVCRGQLKKQGGGARRGQIRHGEAMSKCVQPSPKPT